MTTHPISTARQILPLHPVPERAREILEQPEAWALFLDIDGTLLDVAPTPDSVVVPPSLVARLDDLQHALRGALALLTGRQLAEADRLLAPLRLLGAGVHGTELRGKAGGDIGFLGPPLSTEVVLAMQSISEIAEGILIEQKGSGIAVHYRNAPSARRALELEMARIIEEASYDLVIRPGRKVLEALPRGFSKGQALAHITALEPFRGRRPVMIGDDVGDEFAFAMAEDLGGVGLRVAGEHFGTGAADFSGVRAVRSWLDALSARLHETR